MLEALCKKIDEVLAHASDLSDEEKVAVKQILGTIVIAKVLRRDETCKIVQLPPVDKRIADKVCLVLLRARALLLEEFTWLLF